MMKPVNYLACEKEKIFLDSVVNAGYDRRIINGLGRFMEKNVPEDMQSFYSEDELKSLMALKGTGRDIEARMPVKVTRHYFEQARNSRALQALVKANPMETDDLEGSPDPANQLDYSPVEGLLHKYEMGLIYVASTCSAHCRFCYREELIARKEIQRPDGSTAPKGLARIGDIVAYIREHNRQVAENGGRHPVTGREKLREMLLSGGDPMVLSNRRLAAWFAALAEAEIESIRIGTKEMAFFPDRFDQHLFDMLDRFHDTYPHTQLRFMTHFNHPDEFLRKDGDGRYVETGGGLEWLENTRGAATRLLARNWISIDNQAPIIRGINDDPGVLRVLQRELKRAGIENHYFFCGRDIIGHKAFNVPFEQAWFLLNESQKGLSGVECHARLAVAHHRGKIEIVAVSSEPIEGLPGADDGAVIFKLLRAPGNAGDRSKITIVGRNPQAIWFDGYRDRVLFDEAGLYTKERIPAAKRAGTLHSVANA